MKLSFGFVILILNFVSMPIQAQPFPNKKKEHVAHVHGRAKLNIAFEGAQGQVQFESPASSIVGFEYQAKIAKDRKLQKDQLDLFEKNISAMILFEADLKCVFKTKELQVEQDIKNKIHAEVHAEFNVTCLKSPKGSKITFSIQKYFPKLNEVQGQIIVDDIQKSADIEKVGDSVELK